MKNKNPREKITVKMDALDFIDKLVNHIHSNGFRVVRRYGLYSRRKNKFSIEIVKLYNFIKQRNILDKSNYKNIINEIDQFKPRRIVDTNESEQIYLF